MHVIAHKITGLKPNLGIRSQLIQASSLKFQAKFVENPAEISLFKVNNRNSRKRCKIWSK